jgi:outer membrane protein assembly factor BamB
MERFEDSATPPEKARRTEIEAGTMIKPTAILVLAIALGAIGAARAAEGTSVLTFHGAPDRSGNFVVPTLTVERARGMHWDSGYQAKFSGHLYAQPLYWREAGTGAGVLLAATENNEVLALDATTGRQLWNHSLGPPVSRVALSCGNISPLGVTGTPVIDAVTQTIYVDAAVGGPQGVRHLVFALALKDGTPRPGWPVDIAEALKQRGLSFNARDQNERGALTILDGRLYVPFGGHFGDCGDYHGWVVGIDLRDPRDIVAWATPSRGGGIWAPGGITTDGKSLYAATGNTFGARTWMGGEAVIRLSPDLKASSDRRDFFTPDNWRELDARDADLGGTNPVLVDMPGNASQFVLALGKDGHAYLLDRDNLGGIGGSLANEVVSRRPIRTAPATYLVAGAAFVAFQGPGSHCPAGQYAGDLTVLRVTGGDRPTLATAWCAAVRGAGSPIATTTDGHSEPIVWMVGAEGDNRLHGFKGDTGEPVFAGGGPNEAMVGLRHFQSMIATDRRLYVGADDRIYAFAF